MDPSIPMTVIYGKNSWMKHITLTEFIEARGVEDNTRVEVLYYSLIILYSKMIIPCGLKMDPSNKIYVYYPRENHSDLEGSHGVHQEKRGK